MNHTQQYQEQQEAKRLQNRISSFLEDFKFGTMLSGSGIRKLRGAKPLAVFTTIFFKGEALHWNHLAAFICLIAAVYFVFMK